MAQGSAGNVIAAVCSFFISGLGQLVQGRFLAAVMFFLFTYICYGIAAVMPILIPIAAVGFIFHIWSILNAALFKTK